MSSHKKTCVCPRISERQVTRNEKAFRESGFLTRPHFQSRLSGRFVRTVAFFSERKWWREREGKNQGNSGNKNRAERAESAPLGFLLFHSWFCHIGQIARQIP